MVLAAVVTVLLAQDLGPSKPGLGTTTIALLGVKGEGVRYPELESLVRKQHPALNRCYEGRLLSEPKAAGTMRLAFAIDAHGRTAEIAAESSALEHLEGCVVPVVRGWTFPLRPNGLVKVEAQVTFARAEPRPMTQQEQILQQVPQVAPHFQKGGDPFRSMNVNLNLRGKVVVSIEKISSGDVDEEALSRYVRARKAALLGCYEKELKRNPSLQGTLPVALSINPLGRAANVAIESPGLAPVGACVAAVMRAWVFPFKPAAETRVTLALTFEPQ